MDKLETSLASFYNYLHVGNKSNLKVSAAPVFWHLEHILLVINSIAKALEKSNPEEYKSSFSLKKSIIFALKKFPRGKAKAPKQVQPAANITKESVNLLLYQTKSNLKKLETLSEKAYFNHPVFGMLNKKETVQFFEIHTQHHLKIIDDIIKA
jgi:hypothetical protein